MFPQKNPITVLQYVNQLCADGFNDTNVYVSTAYNPELEDEYEFITIHINGDCACEVEDQEDISSDSPVWYYYVDGYECNSSGPMITISKEPPEEIVDMENYEDFDDLDNDIDDLEEEYEDWIEEGYDD